MDADPDADAQEYAADKRRAELALERELGDHRVLHLRAGLVFGAALPSGRRDGRRHLDVAVQPRMDG